ncbi:MAG: phage tail tube protein [Plesiomonas sp.]|uniref:phage tail tube protein n=1 Tax=Plesiomonas sp. TaxID=2486279 RepID=UPI003F3D7BC0
MSSQKRIAGTCYVKVDGGQLSLTGGIEVPANLSVKESIVGLDSSVHYKETFRAPYIKGTYKVDGKFPFRQLEKNDDMTVTAELANGMVYVLKSAWVEGEINHNAEEGTAEIQFNGEDGFYQ